MREFRSNHERRARFEAIFDQSYEPVLAYARRRAPAYAEDVAAETFVVAWRRLEHVPGDALPWLYGVARKVLSEERRASLRRDALLERMRADIRDRAAEGPGNEASVLEALAALDERDRETILLVAWEGLSAARAAKVLGCSTVAFRVRLHRARKRLRSRLEHDRATARRSTPVLAEEVRSQ